MLISPRSAAQTRTLVAGLALITAAAVGCSAKHRRTEPEPVYPHGYTAPGHAMPLEDPGLIAPDNAPDFSLPMPRHSAPAPMPKPFSPIPPLDEPQEYDKPLPPAPPVPMAPPASKQPAPMPLAPGRPLETSDDPSSRNTQTYEPHVAGRTQRADRPTLFNVFRRGAARPTRSASDPVQQPIQLGEPQPLEPNSGPMLIPHDVI